jgi:hypothetical protein
MVRDYQRLSSNLKNRQAGAARTNEALGNNGNRDGNRNGHVAVTARLPAEEVEVDGEVEGEKKKKKKTPLVTDVTETVVSHNGNKDNTWPEMFDWFWTHYPKKVGKPAALRGWRGIKPQNQSSVDAIADGLERWMAHWDLKADKTFVPHPATWLNQRRWEDKP